MATLVGIAGTSAGPRLDPDTLLNKQERLFQILRDLGQVLVAYSGGTDSAYLGVGCQEGARGQCSCCNRRLRFLT